MLRLYKIFLLTTLVFNIQIAPVHAVNFGLFGDVTYRQSDESGTNDSFALGGLDFYATQEISEKSRGFVEFVLENTDAGLVTDLERLWISRSFSDNLVFAAGRFHTPLGYWNRTYHHGAMLQDTVARPFFLDFEDGAAGVLPVHIVGIMVTGDFIVTSGEISYEFSIGNGPSLNTSAAGFAATASNKPEIEINTTSDVNNNKAIILRTIYKLDSIPLQTAAFVMNSTVAESNGTAAAVATKGSDLLNQTITGLDVFYDDEQIDMILEYYNINNNNKVGVSGSYTATAYYLQVGYRLTKKLKAIARYENLSFDETNDSFFRLLGTQQANHTVIALRYEVDDSNAVKFDINATDLKSGQDTTTYTFQWAFLIP